MGTIELLSLVVLRVAPSLGNTYVYPLSITGMYALEGRNFVTLAFYLGDA